MDFPGKFITIEGQDGAGKTTCIRFIEDLLLVKGIEATITREPGGTRLGEKLRRIILDGHELQIEAMAELLMIFAARAQHLAERVRPALSAGTWVVCDRFTDATYAYQSGGRGLPWRCVEALENMVQGDLRPDLTVLIDVDPETGGRRARQRRRGTADRFESEAEEFRVRVRKAYLDLARLHPGRIRVVDGRLPLSEVTEVVGGLLERLINGAGAVR